MAESLKFDCPRCHRDYELKISLAVAKSKRQRAKCARCGERFEIASRAEALLARMSVPDTELSPDYSRTVADTQISARLAAALLASSGEKQQAELIADPPFVDGPGRDGAEFTEPSSPTQRIGAPLARKVFAQQRSAEEPPVVDEPVVQQEEEEEANLPESLDWIAYAGADPKILHRQLSERERELSLLLAPGRS